MNNKIKEFIDKKIDTDLKGKTVLITGANSGIGFEVANQVLYLGGNVVMACRNLEKAEAAKTELLKRNPNGNVQILKLDLADFTSIQNFINEIKNLKLKIDFFYNNAGVFGLKKSETKQGKEIIMGTNLVGTYFLNKLLLKYYGEINQPIHVIFTTSITAHLYRINYDDPYLEKHHYGKFKIYGSSKRGIVHIFNYFKNVSEGKNIMVSLYHPGITHTPLIDKAYKANWFRKLARWEMGVLFHSAEKAALGVTLLIARNENGSYYAPRGLFGISGYPKKKTVPKRLNKKHLETIKFVEKEILI